MKKCAKSNRFRLNSFCLNKVDECVRKKNARAIWILNFAVILEGSCFDKRSLQKSSFHFLSYGTFLRKTEIFRERIIANFRGNISMGLKGH